MSKRSYEETLFGNLVDCDDPKKELAKVVERLTNKDKRSDDGDSKRDPARWIYLMKESYAMLYVAQFDNDNSALLCVFSTKSLFDDFITIISSMKPAIAKKVYAASGSNDMKMLLKLAGFGLPSRIDDTDYYIMQLIKMFKVGFEFVGDAAVFLDEIACTKTSRLSEIERIYLTCIKKSFNKRHENIK